MSINDPSHAVLSHDEPVPGWRVVSFIDPAGSGKDLAFTQGLAAFDLPELLLWARPTEGSDPGADWLLTHRERSRLLSGWALEMVTGRLAPGEEREQRFDGGDAVAHFRFGRPTSASPVTHPHLTRQTWVLSVAWSLRRPPAVDASRQVAVLSPGVERQMRLWIAKADATRLAWRSRLAASEKPAGATSGLAALSIGAAGPNRFGPMTPWVDARIAQVLAAGPDVIGTFLRRLHLAGHARSEECVIEQLTSLADGARRNSAFREASRAAQELALAVIGWPEQPLTAWDQAVASAALVPSFPDGDTAEEPSPSVVLTDGLEVLLLTAVLADVAAPSLIASGSGPWEWAVCDERLPGRPWLAEPRVRQATRALLAQATATQLAATAGRARLPFGLTEQHTVSLLLGGLQTTAAASAKQGSLFRRDQRRGLPRSIVQSTDRLAGQLLTAMALPHRLPPGGWDVVRDTLYPLAPNLPSRP